MASVIDEFRATQPEYLRIARRRLGQDQATAAAAHGVTLDTYLDWEKGRTRPKTPRLQLQLQPYEICELLRRRRCLGQAQLGRIMGCSRVGINQMEVGKIDATRLVNYWESLADV